MRGQSGTNVNDIKLYNRALILRLIATNYGISRVDLSRMTGLSKMAVGNIVHKLKLLDLIEENEVDDQVKGNSSNLGRKPIILTIAKESPCICSMLIKRGLCQVALAGLNGKIFLQVEKEYEELSCAQDLINILIEAFSKLKSQTERKIIAVGISSVGPVNSSSGTILNPPYFYDIKDLPIAKIIEKITSLPTFLVNDANAGALAENYFGLGKDVSNFVYLHIMNGIGSGLILENKLYNGDTGQSGEIGHTSICFSGPPCICGNVGCLDLYANITNMHRHINQLKIFYPNSKIADMENPRWDEIVNEAYKNDYLAISALNEFCGYISYALIDILNILDISFIIVGYSSKSKGTVIEDLLREKISSSILCSQYREIKVVRSSFGGDAPLIGAISFVAEKIFNSSLPFLIDDE